MAADSGEIEHYVLAQNVLESFVFSLSQIHLLLVHEVEAGDHGWAELLNVD